VIFSHSNPSAVYPHVRNIPDDLLVACARSGGVVNLNGVGLFLGPGADGRGDNSTETLLRHIDYVVQLTGPQHVGLDLDYVFDVAELEEYRRTRHHGSQQSTRGAQSLARSLLTREIRRPIYDSSSGRWRSYRAHLEPLVRALRRRGVALPADA